MSYRIAGIDVHKKMLAVVVSNVEIEGEYQFERRLFGSSPDQLRTLAAWAARTARMIRQLRSLGYRIDLPNPQHPSPAQRQ